MNKDKLSKRRRPASAPRTPRGPTAACRGRPTDGVGCLSTGTVRDNEDRTRQFKRVLKKRGYELLYKEVPFGHDWNNWKPLLDDILRYFYAVKDPIPRARGSP